MEFRAATLAGVNLVRTLDSVKVLPGEPTDGASQTWTRLRLAYADSVTASNTATHAVVDVFPNCQVK